MMVLEEFQYGLGLVFQQKNKLCETSLIKSFNNLTYIYQEYSDI